MSFVLILTIVHAGIGAVDTQRVPGFDSYNECATHAVAWADSQRALYSDAELKWQCQEAR
jgi:hypothetical protein